MSVNVYENGELIQVAGNFNGDSPSYTILNSVNTMNILDWANSVTPPSTAIQVGTWTGTDGAGYNECSLLLLGYNDRKTVVAFNYPNKGMKYRHIYQGKWYTDWITGF